MVALLLDAYHPGFLKALETNEASQSKKESQNVSSPSTERLKKKLLTLKNQKSAPARHIKWCRHA